ncbi:MAG: zinc ABC transporter solute-binding protein [Syntrophomonadaceae bacterium]|nr:zinc ABC transporter solute-binding protein [Syntrophomonadaceae bacterium]
MRSKVISWLLVFIMTSALTGCSTTAEKNGVEVNTVKPVKVLVSILPQADFVGSIGGEKVEVTVLIPPGANPEDYEMSPRQIQKISEADMYITVGNIPFEEINMERIKSANPDMSIISFNEKHDENTEAHKHDPHVWLSPRLVMEQAEIICKELSLIDSANETFYLKNKNAYISELERLDIEIKELLADRQRDHFLVYHPAWGYFAEDYGLVEIAVEKDGKEPTAGEMARIIEEAESRGIKEVLVSPQHSTRSAETIAKQMGGEIKVVDPLPGNYIEGMREAAYTFKEVLND